MNNQSSSSASLLSTTTTTTPAGNVALFSPFSDTGRSASMKVSFFLFSRIVFDGKIISMIHHPPSEGFRIFLIVVFLIILLVGLIGNSLVLLSVLTSHLQIRRSSTNLLLVNLSCADLIILIFNLFDVLQFSLDRSWPTAWHLGLPLCKIVRFAQVFGCYVSVQTLLVISIERY
jgi:hypothetical protein